LSRRSLKRLAINPAQSAVIVVDMQNERVRQAEQRVTDEKARIKDLAAKILVLDEGRVARG
jgi:hypothetical protein